MATHDMFLAMILTNARREEARALTLTVAAQKSSIEMTLADGTARTLSAPPPEVLTRIIENLAGGQTLFESSVFSVTVETVKLQREAGRLSACIFGWTIEHR